MNRKWLLIASAVTLVLPAALAAQEAPAPKRRAPRAESRAFSFTFADNRGRIGVLVNTNANAATDRYGAKIDGVTPGGPAEKAGIKAGDIITKFNGTSLAGVSAEDGDDSGPGMRLIELGHQLEPGDTVRVEYRRGSDTKSVTLVAAADLSDHAWTGVMPRMAFPSPRMEMGDLGPLMALGEGNSFAFCFGDSWCDLDLVTLNADLGAYFGTREGLLVVKAPADSALPLKSGDVILSIGGRKPTSPAHAMRILRSYDTGEAVSIEIMRHERRQTISWTVPEESERNWYRTPPGRSRERGQPSVRKIRPGSRMKVRVSAI